MADQGSEGLLSPFLRSRRIAAAKPHLKGRVLDVGCGAGLLAEHVPPSNYLGVDIDEASLQLARKRYPKHTFTRELPPEGSGFHTIVALAVIEHVKDPAQFLRQLAARLAEDKGGCIVCTTPHPAVDWVHTAGASIGLFSRHANEEHEQLLDQSRLAAAGASSGLQLVFYRRFLLGANQVAVFSW